MNLRVLQGEVVLQLWFDQILKWTDRSLKWWAPNLDQHENKFEVAPTHGLELFEAETFSVADDDKSSDLRLLLPRNHLREEVASGDDPLHTKLNMFF